MDPRTALALEIYDALMVLCPGGWTRAEMALQSDARGGVRVGAFDSHLGAEPGTRPEIGVERGAWMGALNEALSDLVRAQPAGDGWDGACARFERHADGGGALALTDATGTLLATVALAGAETAPMVFTERFFDAVARAEVQMGAAQRAFLDEIAGHDEWNFDQSTGQLVLSKGVLPWRSYAVSIVGSYVMESGEFLWAWANDSLAPSLRAAAVALRDGARSEAGMGALLRPYLPTGDGLAYTLAMLAAARLGARGIYQAVYGPGVLFFAIAAG